MIENIDVRFFAYEYDEESGELDIVEIDESEFTRLRTDTRSGGISYGRHTVFDNGCRQICLTIDAERES